MIYDCFDSLIAEVLIACSRLVDHTLAIDAAILVDQTVAGERRHD